MAAASAAVVAAKHKAENKDGADKRANKSESERKAYVSTSPKERTVMFGGQEPKQVLMQLQLRERKARKANEQEEAGPPPERSPFFFLEQQYVRKLYNGDISQISVAALIFINFVTNAVEAQFQPDPSDKFISVMSVFEMFFTVVFTIELAVNMYAHWWWPFWQSGWNIFDFVVVSISLISLILPNLSGVSVLRLLRAFRVFRLFKRLESLRKIIHALEEAIPGCMNAFSIVILVSSIYAILGVEFYSKDYPYFKNFSAALFTLFQVMTGDSWAEVVARPIIKQSPAAAIYFITYILCTTFMLMNVVIGVLLEKMVLPPDEPNSEDDDGLKEELQLELTQIKAIQDQEPDFTEFLVDPEQWSLCIQKETALLERIVLRMDTLQAQFNEEVERLKARNEPSKSPASVASPSSSTASAGGGSRISSSEGGGESPVDSRGSAVDSPTDTDGGSGYRKKANSALINFKLYAKDKRTLMLRHSLLSKVQSGYRILQWQPEVRAKYNSEWCQIGVAVLIFLNFLQNALEAQVIDPSDTWKTIFEVCEMFFTVVFLIELLVNMYAHWFNLFWSSAWNWFDFIVVMVSVVSMTLPNLNGVSSLRLLRAFRVFRLFKRLESLRNIIKALEDAVPGCANAFSILILVNSLYAILGVEFFGLEWPRYFKNFTASFYSLFQVMTGDSWAEMVARPVIERYPQAAIFFVSYILVASMTLMNVVIAVLLEKMACVAVENEAEKASAKEAVVAAEKELRVKFLAKTDKNHGITPTIANRFEAIRDAIKFHREQLNACVLRIHTMCEMIVDCPSMGEVKDFEGQLEYFHRLGLYTNADGPPGTEEEFVPKVETDSSEKKKKDSFVSVSDS